MTSPSNATVKKNEEQSIFECPERELFFPAGVLGFPGHRRYKLAPFTPADGGDSPFFILSTVEQDLSFPLIHPASMALDYHFPVSPELLTALNAQSPEELTPLLIVTVRDQLQEITVNLQGPLIVNLICGLGLQLIVEDYPLRHPLLKATGR